MFDTTAPKFFGRRKGRTIRKAKTFLLENFLQKIAIDENTVFEKKSLFGIDPKEIHLEIGFGDGGYLAELSKMKKDIGFIGAEVFQNGIANLLTLLTGIKKAEQETQDVCLLPQRTDNVRVFAEDVRLLLKHIPDSFIDKIYLLFPDPWPKKRHADRRFINPENLKSLARILKKDGHLLIATDHKVYKHHVLHTMRECKDFVWTAQKISDFNTPPSDWVETKYQRKAIREGRKPVFFDYKKI